MSDIKKEFNEKGYVIIKNAIPYEKIDKLLSSFEDFKNNKNLFYSQSEHNWRLTIDELDKNNLLKTSIENFTDLPWAIYLSRAGRDILQSKEVHKILKELSNEEEMCMWQNMLFDKSTGTVDHVDTYYLDTNPMGKLIAGWFALENINGEGGSFHVYPGSHLDQSMSWKGLNHDSFVNWSIKESKKYKMKKILLNKGDALFWHPSLMHGSSLTQKEGKSRKSITAHYYPVSYLRGGNGQNNINKLESSYQNKVKREKKKMRSFGYPILVNKSRRQIFFTSSKGLIRFLFLKNKSKLLMNRSNYDWNSLK